jgi:hypothetical protein
LDDTALNLMAGGVAQNIQAYFVADSAFPLGNHVMKIYSDRAWSVVTNITITNLENDDIGHDLTLS